MAYLGLFVSHGLRFAVGPLRCFHLHVYEHDHRCVAESSAAESCSGTMVGDPASEG